MIRKLLQIASMAVLLGLAMEVLVLLIGLLGGATPSGAGVAADAVQKVSWSFIVCVGLALGSLVAKAPVAGMSFAGLVAAPIAFTIARALHKGVSQALALGGASAPLPVMALMVLKAVEYGCLGLLLSYVGTRRRSGAAAHVGIGLAVGAVFGGAALFLMPAAPLAVQMARGANEIVFPVGCSLVLFAARALQPHLPEPGQRISSRGVDSSGR